MHSVMVRKRCAAEPASFGCAIHSAEIVHDSVETRASRILIRKRPLHNVFGSLKSATWATNHLADAQLMNASIIQLLCHLVSMSVPMSVPMSVHIESPHQSRRQSTYQSPCQSSCQSASSQHCEHVSAGISF